MLKRNNEISNSDDIIDSRDVIARISELQTEINEATEGAGKTWDADETVRHGQSRDEYIAEHIDINLSDERDELAALLALQEEAEGYAPDWTYGATLIRDSYFVDYTQELLQDIGDLPKDLPGYLVIDWEATARNIQYDYTGVDFDGVTYWVR